MSKSHEFHLGYLQAIADLEVRLETSKNNSNENLKEYFINPRKQIHLQEIDKEYLPNTYKVGI